MNDETELYRSLGSIEATLKELVRRFDAADEDKKDQNDRIARLEARVNRWAGAAGILGGIVGVIVTTLAKKFIGG